ncbi:MAG: ABC transporter ATP-binding protein/permease [Oscillospiraceae bacterium]|nr:ABC transporter ATP-binding protein/permease [Oscillospiraceae bacterium]
MQTITVPFDLLPSGRLCHGRLCWDGERVYAALADGEEIFHQSLEAADELVQRSGYGCGRLELKMKDGEELSAVRYTMRNAAGIAEFCKAVNHYLKTGEVTAIDEKELRHCPECGRSLPPETDHCLFCMDSRTIWKRGFSMLRPLHGLLAVTLLLILCYDLTNLSLPMLSRWLLDNVLGGAELVALPLFSGAVRPQTALLVFGIVTAALYCVGQLLLGNSARLLRRGKYQLQYDLQCATYAKVQSLSQQSLARRTSGDLLNRVTRDSRRLGDAADYVRGFLEKAVLILVAAALMLVTNPLLTLVALLPLPFIPVVVRRFWRRIRQVYHRLWVCSARETSALHDIVKGIRVVKTFGAEEREVRKFSAVSRRLMEVAIRAERFWALAGPPSRAMPAIGELLVMALGGYLVIKGRLTVGELFQFTLYSALIYEPIRWMTALPRVLSGTGTSLLKIFELLDEPETIPAAKNPVREPITGGVEFEGVRFGYKPYEPVLKAVDLQIRPNEMLGLVGHSGAGKSTLINLVMRLYDVNEGVLKIGGRDIRAYDYAYLREHIGVVFQQTFLFSGTVFDNIAYAKPQASPAEVMRAARVANAHDFILRLPDGYNTLVGEDGHNLSGGERQRLAIARAVLKDPRILILDEATSALDPETENTIQEALRRLVKGRTTIAIAHRLSTLRHADRLAVIEKGRVAELGSHRDLLEKKGIYYDLVMAQQQMAAGKKGEERNF